MVYSLETETVGTLYICIAFKLPLLFSTTKSLTPNLWSFPETDEFIVTDIAFSSNTLDMCYNFNNVI